MTSDKIRQRNLKLKLLEELVLIQNKTDLDKLLIKLLETTQNLRNDRL